MGVKCCFLNLFLVIYYSSDKWLYIFITIILNSIYFLKERVKMLKFNLSVDDLRDQRKKCMDEISNSDILDKIYKQLFNFHEVAIVGISDNFI